MFQVVTGDEGGLLKRVCIAAADGFDAVKAQQVTVDAFEGGPQSRARAVEALAWCGLRDDTDGLHSAFVSVTKDGEVTTWNLRSLAKLSVSSGLGGPTVGFAPLSDTKFLACNSSGVVRIWERGVAVIGATDEATQFSVGENIAAVRLSQDSTALACGGRDHDLQVWDIETQTVKFNARNLKHDNLDMQIPIWITGMQFLDPVEGGFMLSVCTGNGHVRVYDSRAGRRPTKSELVSDHPLHHIIPAPDNSVIVADTIGNVLRVGLGEIDVLGRYVGPAGAVKGLGLNADGSVLASVGLDRRLRLHSVRKRCLRADVYLKQRLTAVLVGPTVKAKKKALKRKGEEDEDDEEEEEEEGGASGDDTDDVFDALEKAGSESGSEDGESGSEDGESEGEEDGESEGEEDGESEGEEEESGEAFGEFGSDSEDDDDEEEEAEAAPAPVKPGKKGAAVAAAVAGKGKSASVAAGKGKGKAVPPPVKPKAAPKPPAPPVKRPRK